MKPEVDPQTFTGMGQLYDTGDAVVTHITAHLVRRIRIASQRTASTEVVQLDRRGSVA